MKNILNEKPEKDLKGRLLASVEFVSDADIADKRVLNVGCGFGWCELNFLDRGVTKMVGIEISEKDLQAAKKHIQNDRVSFSVGSAIKLPFGDSTFDTVVSWEVIEHIPSKTETIMFAEVSRILAPRGVFYLSTPYATFFSNILDPAWWLVGHRHYSYRQLSKLAENNNFEVIDTKIKGKWWTLFSILNMYISKWMFRRSPIRSDIFSKKEHEEYMLDDGFADIFIKFQKKV
jgi:2-polyprenyl-3-methyl-5-hydroxy-6-metoxy-1,4-benzoquinol methylase